MAKKSKKLIERDDQIYQLATLVAGEFSLQEVLDKLAEAAVKLTNVEACSIRLLDEDVGELKMRSTYGLSDKYRNKGEVSKEDAVIKEAFAGGAVVLDDMRVDSRVKYPQAAIDEGLISQLTVAMQFRGKNIGVLRLYSPTPKRFDGDSIKLARSVASQCAVAIRNAQLYSQAIEGAKLAHQMKLAGVVQRRMIPEKAPKMNGLDIAAKYIPCFDVGGDLYDFFKLSENHLVIAIADVIGKGVPAAVMTSMFKGAIRAYADMGGAGHIEQTINHLNAMACDECRSGEFVTLFYAVVDTSNMQMSYCCCGHEPTLLFRAGKLIELDKGGLVLGVDKKADYEIETIDLMANDCMVFYTDGLIDAMDYKGSIWGREHLLLAAGLFCCDSASVMIDNLLGYRRRFVGLSRQVDDTSIVVVKVKDRK